jgi:hypothetical protein
MPVGIFEDELLLFGACLWYEQEGLNRHFLQRYLRWNACFLGVYPVFKTFFYACSLCAEDFMTQTMMKKNRRTLITTEDIYYDFIGGKGASLLWINHVDELAEKLKAGELEIQLTHDGKVKYAVIYEGGELKKVAL